MRPICVRCRAEMHCHKTGRRVGIVSGGDLYQVWAGDEYACSCGNGVIIGFPPQPLAESFQPGFEALVKLEEGRSNLVRVEV